MVNESFVGHGLGMFGHGSMSLASEFPLEIVISVAQVPVIDTIPLDSLLPAKVNSLHEHQLASIPISQRRPWHARDFAFALTARSTESHTIKANNCSVAFRLSCQI